MYFDSDGNVLSDFRSALENGEHLVLMPLSRLFIEGSARSFPGPVIFYPPDLIELTELNIIPNRKNTSSLAESASEASGVNESTFYQQPVAALPCTFNWAKFSSAKHAEHMGMIRALSEQLDTTCLNFLRYAQCPIDFPDCLPGRGGQINSDHMMAGALLYNHTERRSRIIGGAAFTHFFTKGLGLCLDGEIEHSRFPKTGEVGMVTAHALMLYRDMLESSSQTSMFVQCLSLMECLADPEDYTRFEEVSKVVARHVAKNPTEYTRLLGRLHELTSKRDTTTKRHLGYRTRIVHMGDRIESILPDADERHRLFEELDGYIKCVIDHMISHSAYTWLDYSIARKALRPFDSMP